MLLFSGTQATAKETVCGELTAEPSQVPKDFSGLLTISAKNDCFEPGAGFRYIVKGKDFTISLLEGDTLKVVDRKTFTIQISNLPHTGPLTFYICQLNVKADNCNTSSNNSPYYFGSFLLEAEGDQPPEDYNLPVLDRKAQTTCAYQTGSNDVNLKVTGLETGKSYHWWLDGANDRHTTTIQGANPVPEGTTELAFNLGGEGAFQDSKNQKICVDRSDKDRHATPKNCIVLSFTGPPPADSSCQGSAPIVDPVPPPCATYETVAENLDSDVKDGGCLSVNSAFGPLSTEPGTFIPRILAIFLSLSGGIALLLIIRSGYQLLTSQGDAEKVKEARERITSAIIGILFMIFSLVVLQTIGVDILHLPGFGK